MRGTLRAEPNTPIRTPSKTSARHAIIGQLPTLSRHLYRAVECSAVHQTDIHEVLWKTSFSTTEPTNAKHCDHQEPDNRSGN